MRHSNNNRKFGRVRKQRKALLNSLARSLVLHDKIETTEEKAKELRPFIEKVITRGKVDNVANRRLVREKVGKLATVKVFETLSKNYDKRAGGYTRITKSGRKLSDGSKRAIIAFV